MLFEHTSNKVDIFSAHVIHSVHDIKVIAFQQAEGRFKG